MNIRPIVPADVPGIRALIPRFAEGFLPPWRTPGSVEQLARCLLDQACAALPASSALLVAEAHGGAVAGFIHLQTQADAFTGEPVGYVSDLAVAADWEGRGIARRLLDAGEAWSRARGHRLLTLYVFAGNRRARALYQDCGFQPEVLKLVKACS